MRDDIMSIWSRLAGRRYATVSTNSNVDAAGADNGGHDNEIEDTPTDTIIRDPARRSLQRKSSVVINQFFRAALPVHRDGRRRWPRRSFMLMTLGLLGLASGCFVLVFQPYDLLFKLKVVFAEGGEIFELWRDPPVELYLKVYLWNVTNHDDYISGKADKLHFQEVGPYVYKEGMAHSNVTFNGNGTVTAVPRHPLTYMREKSVGHEDDLLILPNIALFSIANVMRDSSYLTRWGLNVLIRQTDTRPLVKMTAKEFMFGYESTLVTLGNTLLPSWIKFDKLGLIDRMYDFDGDYETVYTGEDDVRLTGLIEKYNGDVNLPQWTGSCANVKGASDGAKFKSYIEPNDTLLFFRKSLCRSAQMVRTGEKIVKGLRSYRYKFRDNELDNGANITENKCFCRHGRCLPPGLIDVTDCYYGFPIALSYPHFYMSDPSLIAAVEGLSPEIEKHESYFFIQPKSGLPVDLAFRFQINMALQDISSIANVDRFSNFVLPLLWFEIGMYELPDSMNNRFWLYLNVLPVVQDAACGALFLGGGIFLVWSVVKILLHQESADSAKRRQGTLSCDNDNSRQRRWYDNEIRRSSKRAINFFSSEKRTASVKSRMMDTYYSSLLLEPKDDSQMPEQHDNSECIV